MISQRLGRPVVHLQRFKPQASTRVTAGLLSAMLHLGVLVLILVSGGRGDGVHEDPMPAARLVLLDARLVDRREAIERAQSAPAPSQTPAMPEPPATPDSVLGERLDLQSIEPPSVPPPELDIPRVDAEPIQLVAVDADVEHADEAAPTSAAETPSTFVMPQEQASEVLEHIERLARELAKTPRAQVTWKQDGRRYHAKLVLETAHDGVEPERAIAEIRAEDQGRQLRTWISLKRLPFSHFAQVIDRWDPMVQLHDDEIVGRMHINSRFNVLQDLQAAPRLLGKVTTAAGGVNMERRGRRRDADVFREGIETRAGRIRFSNQEESFDWAKDGANARVHELAGDSQIRFLGDGGYSWRDRESGDWLHRRWPERKSVFFIAAPGAAVYLQGIVSGKVLVYSPKRIVVEGNITYARDPRSDPGSEDYLGLVCDRNIEVAPPEVTGPGDLHIQAALFAKRRVVVKKTRHRHSATLNIFGSLAAGTMSASEPRYATKVEYDWRFERLRPPGFPSTNRFAAEDWDRQWTEVSERSASAGF